MSLYRNEILRWVDLDYENRLELLVSGGLDIDYSFYDGFFSAAAVIRHFEDELRKLDDSHPKTNAGPNPIGEPNKQQEFAFA